MARFHNSNTGFSHIQQTPKYNAHLVFESRMKKKEFLQSYGS